MVGRAPCPFAPGQERFTPRGVVVGADELAPDRQVFVVYQEATVELHVEHIAAVAVLIESEHHVQLHGEEDSLKQFDCIHHLTLHSD